MAGDKVKIKATCLCGAAQHELVLSKADLPLKQVICHCHSCRHMTGTLHLTALNLPESYTPPPEVISKLTSFQFTQRLTPHFCSNCGSHMLTYCWYDADDHSKGGQWDVMSGTLEKADVIFEPALHEFIADTLDGGFADFMPTFKGKSITRWAGDPGKSEQLPLFWQSPDRPPRKSADKVQAHCKCGGVQFWIARPSSRSTQASCPWPDLLIPDHSKETRPPPTAWWLRDGGRKFFAGVCACDSCRLDTGMEWMEWAFVPTIDMSLDEQGQVPFSLPFGTLKAYHSSPGVTRYHCEKCGASVFFTSDERHGLVDVAVGVLDAAEGARAESLLEFRTHRLSFREDGVVRARDLTLAVENGLEEFARHRLKELDRS